MTTGCEHRLEQLQKLLTREDFQRYLPYMRNVRATVLGDIYLDIVEDCKELNSIIFDGKSYPQIRFRIRGDKYLKRMVSKEFSEGMTTDVSDIALETVQHYFTIYR
jgi:hypothetical protein